MEENPLKSNFSWSIHCIIGVPVRAEIHKMAAELTGSAVGARPKTAAATGLGSQAGGIKIERLL